jgi:capsular polysaccharide biosynthesis protein
MSHGPADAAGAVDSDDLAEDDLTLTMPRVAPDEPRAVPSTPAPAPSPATDVPDADWADDDLTGAGSGRGQFASGLAAGLAAVPYLRAAIRRRLGLVCVFALVGLLLGVGYFKARPPAAKAEIEVYVTQAPGVEPQDAVLTDVALLQTRSLAALALKQLGLSETVTKFMGSFTAVSLTDKVLEIIVSAPTSADAVQRANVISTTFLHYRASLIAAQRQATVRQLNDQLAKGEQQVASLTNQVYAEQLLPASAERTDKLAQLNGSLATASANLTSLEGAVSSYEVGSESGNAQEVTGSYPLYKAAPLPPSKYRKADIYAIGGLVAGLILGMVAAAAAALMSDRLRRRDDVANAVGAPVRLSVGPLKLKRSGLPGRREVTLSKALEAVGTVDVQRVAEHLRAAVPDRSDGAAALAVVAMDDPYAAVLPVLALALSCARAGGQVIIADLSAGTVAGQLLDFADPGVRIVTVDGEQIALAVPDAGDLVPMGPLPQRADEVAAHRSGTAAADRGSAGGGARPGRIVLGHGSAVQSTAGYQLAAAYQSADLMLTVVTLDPALGAQYLPTWATDAVVIVTAGESTATKIHSISEMTRLAGTTISCAILVGADKDDESIGLMPVSSREFETVTDTEAAPGPAEAGLEAHRADERRS